MGSSSLTVQLQEVFDEYTTKVKRVANNANDSVSKQSVQRLRNNSARRTGRYARGWGVKKIPGSAGIYTVIVRNRTDYQLTHLLEKPHLIRNKKGTYGYTEGDGKIKEVEEWANQELPREIERELQ